MLNSEVLSIHFLLHMFRSVNTK